MDDHVFSRVFSTLITFDADDVCKFAEIIRDFRDNAKQKPFHIDDYFIAEYGTTKPTSWLVIFGVSPDPITLNEASKIIKSKAGTKAYPGAESFVGVYESENWTIDTKCLSMHKYTETNNFLRGMSKNVQIEAKEINMETLFSNPHVTNHENISLWPFQDPAGWQLKLRDIIKQWAIYGNGSCYSNIIIKTRIGVPVAKTINTLTASIGVKDLLKIELVCDINRRFLNSFVPYDDLILVVDDSLPSSYTDQKIAAVNDLLFKRKVRSPVDDMVTDWDGMLILILYDTSKIWSIPDIENLHRNFAIVIEANDIAVEEQQLNAHAMRALPMIPAKRPKTDF